MLSQFRKADKKGSIVFSPDVDMFTDVLLWNLHDYGDVSAVGSWYELPQFIDPASNVFIFICHVNLYLRIRLHCKSASLNLRSKVRSLWFDRMKTRFNLSKLFCWWELLLPIWGPVFNMWWFNYWRIETTWKWISTKHSTCVYYMFCQNKRQWNYND